MSNSAGVTNVSNPKRTVVAVNGSGGAWVLISCSIGGCGYAEIQECPDPATYTGGTFNGQGLLFQRADENYANTYPAVPSEIIQVGDAIRKNRSEGMPSFTYPDGQVRPATPWIKVKSASATATKVEVREWRQLESA